MEHARQPASDRSRPDADLVAAALAGSREALSELLRRHWDTAVALSARVLNSPDLARDAVQEAAIAAMTSMDRLRCADRFGAWFCGIALNVSRRWLRQLRAEVPATATDRASLVPGPAELAELADLAARVRDAISRLPPGQRDAVLLFYLQGLSHREAAAELGISPGAVKARLHQARAALAPGLARIIGARQGRLTAVAGTTTEWTDAVVSEVRQSPDDGDQRKHIMMLAERDGDRLLPMWIGPAEATALAITLEAVEMPRPFTYQLAASLVAASGARITEVRITKLEPPLFYAAVLVEGADGVREVDSRPSDAVNLALATGAPLRVNDALFGAGTPGWQEDLASYSVVTADLATQARERMARGLAERSERE